MKRFSKLFAKRTSHVKQRIVDMADETAVDSPDEEDDLNENERLNVEDAALIWMSNRKDEDYMFGYTEDELESAL